MQKENKGISEIDCKKQRQERQEQQQQKEKIALLLKLQHCMELGFTTHRHIGMDSSLEQIQDELDYAKRWLQDIQFQQTLRSYKMMLHRVFGSDDGTV